MRFFQKIGFFISLLLLFTKVLYAAEWYENYENAKKRSISSNGNKL